MFRTEFTSWPNPSLTGLWIPFVGR
jgi:hypothetical protein